MPAFSYQALDYEGGVSRGVIDAVDAADAVRQLESLGWTVESVSRVVKMTDDESGDEIVAENELEEVSPPVETRKSTAWARLTAGETATVAESLSEVMEAGLPLVPGLRALADESDSGRIRSNLLTLAEELESGRELESVLADRPGTDGLRALVRAGARSGQSAQVLSQFVEHSRQSAELRRRTAMAFGYPLILFVVSTVVLIFVLLFLVPGFESIFQDFGTELPGLTVFVIEASRIVRLQSPWVVTITLTVVAVLVGVIAFGLSARERRRLLWGVPLVGTIVKNAAMARFTRLLGLLIGNQVPLAEALRLAGDAANDPVVKDAAFHLAQRAEDGASAAATAPLLRRFPASFRQIMAWDQPVDATVEALLALSELYYGRTKVHSAAVGAVGGPVIVIYSVGTLGLIIFSLFLPLIRLLNDLS